MKTEMELAYVVVDSTDPAAINRYFGEVIGLMPGAPTAAGASTWRNDARTQRVVVRKAGRDDAAVLGFEAVDAAALDRIAGRLREHGCTLAVGTSAECAERRVQQLLRTQAPWGVDVELCLGLEQAATPFASKMFPDGFVTEGQGFGHVVFGIGDPGEYEAARAFAFVLGLRLSDKLDMPLGPPGSGAPQLKVTFMHCNQRHHSLALACLPLPPGAPMTGPKLHHINFEVRDVAAVGQAYERALAAHTPIANTIGQHDNDAMISFYGRSPAGWQVEVGATGRTVGDDWNDTQVYDRISRWGHQPPAVLAQMQHDFMSPPPGVPA